MLKRKAFEQLKNWKLHKNKKCLVVQGARQTGKTFAIERFAEENYDELVEITPKSIRLRKKILNNKDRERAARK